MEHTEVPQNIDYGNGKKEFVLLNQDSSETSQSSIRDSELACVWDSYAS